MFYDITVQVLDRTGGPLRIPRQHRLSAKAYDAVTDLDGPGYHDRVTLRFDAADEPEAVGKIVAGLQSVYRGLAAWKMAQTSEMYQRDISVWRCVARLDGHEEAAIATIELANEAAEVDHDWLEEHLLSVLARCLLQRVQPAPR